MFSIPERWVYDAEAMVMQRVSVVGGSRVALVIAAFCEASGAVVAVIQQSLVMVAVAVIQQSRRALLGCLLFLGVQPRQNDGEVNDAVGGRSSQMDLQEARQRIEQRDAPEDIFGAVLETAAQDYGADEDIEVMLEELASDPELADEYMKLLLEQVGNRVESESGANKQS